MSIIKDSLYGFAIGDAIGVPIEFENREKLMKKPVTKMLGYGSYDVAEGTWSDDTAMTLATMDSIIKKEGKIDCDDIADKFCNWINYADYTATGEIFDVGMTTKYAMMRYWDKKKDACKCGSIYESENGNGSLMRMLPIALFSYYKNLKDKEIYKIVKDVSSITHAHERSILGCFIYVKFVIFLLNGKDKFDAYKLIKKVDYKMFSKEELDIYSRILKKDIYKIKLNDIKSTGYVVDTLETVLWVVLNSESYDQSIIGSINLGGDTDTIGAITGSITGIIYGYKNINKTWLKYLRNKRYLNSMIKKFETLFDIK